MAETVGDLLVKISADTGDLKAKLAEIGVSLDNMASKAGRSSEGFTKLQASTVSLEAGLSLAAQALRPLIAGLSELADFVEASVTAAGREEAAQARLAATLRAGGQFTQEYAAQLNAAAEALGALTGFSSEAITESQALFVAFGATADQIPQLTQAAITLAKTFGGELTERARQLITDINGDSEALSRLGIKHDEASGKAQRFADVLAFTAKVADPASISGYEQSISQLGNSFENVQKALGAVIISTPEFQAVIATIKETLDQASAAIGDNKAALIDFVGSSISLAVSGLGVLETALFDVVKAFELLSAALPNNLASTVQKLAAGISLTPIADSIGAVIDKTADFQNRFEAAAESIKAKTAEAAGQSGVAAIGVAATQTAESAKQIAPAFDTAASSVKAASQSVVEGAAQLRATALSTASSIVQLSDGVFVSGVSAAASVSKLNESFDRTPAQAKKAKDAIKELSEATAGIKLEASVAGFSELQAELAKTEANVRKVGAAANLTGSEINSLLGPALDAVKAKFESTGTKAFADIQQDIARSAAGVQLFGKSFDQTGPIIAKVRQELIELKASGLGATEAAGKLRTQLAGLEKSQKISIRAETDQATSAVDKLLRDIRSGSDPVTIAVDKSKADKEIADLEAKIKSLGENDPIRLDAEKTLAELKIKETQALARQPQVMPVDADTSAAEQRIAELNAAAQDAVAGKSKRLGEFDPSDLNSALDQARSSISAGDAGAIQESLAALRNFLKENLGAAFGAGTQNLVLVQAAIRSLAEALGKLGVSSLGGPPSLGTGSFDAALRELASRQAGQIDKQEDTNRLLRENNDLSRANLDATRDVGSSLSLGNINTALIEKTRAATGVRGATF